MTIFKILNLLKWEEPEINQNGNMIFRMFFPANRYMVDFADDRRGWKQYDTDQDAHYFGVWVNPDLRFILSYTEGDWTLVVCTDDEHYNAEIKLMNDFYGEGRIAKLYQEGKTTIFVQNREAFFKKENPS